MSKTEILAELPKLTDKAALDTALAKYQKNQDADSTLEEVEIRIRAKFHQ